jgi:hypothetical protein
MGYWPGDKNARANYSAYLRTKYGTIENLNKTWETGYTEFTETTPKLPQDMSSMQENIDFHDWYYESLINQTELWLKIVRKYYPEPGIVELCTGGRGEKESGADFTLQAKIAKKYNAGMRVTNEGYDFLENFVMNRWAATACKFYKIPLGYEPAGGTISAKRTPYRIFNLITSGGEEFYFYRFLKDGGWDNPAEIDEQNLDECLKLFAGKTQYPVVNVCMYLPQVQIQLQSSYDLYSQFLDTEKAVRKTVDLDVVDNDLVNDGALDNYKVLVLWNVSIEQENVLHKIDEWLTNNACVLICLGNQKLKTVNGSDAYNNLFFDKKNLVGSKDKTNVNRYAYKHGKGFVVRFNETVDTDKIKELVANTVANLNQLSDEFVNIPRINFSDKNVYGSIMTENGAGKILLINTSFDTTAQIKITVDDSQQNHYKFTNKEWDVKIEPLKMVELK